MLSESCSIGYESFWRLVAVRKDPLMTKKKRLKAEQIIPKLREAETMLAAGKSVGEVIQHLELVNRLTTGGSSITPA